MKILGKVKPMMKMDLKKKMKTMVTSVARTFSVKKSVKNFLRVVKRQVNGIKADGEMDRVEDVVVETGLMREEEVVTVDEDVVSKNKKKRKKMVVISRAVKMMKKMVAHKEVEAEAEVVVEVKAEDVVEVIEEVIVSKLVTTVEVKVIYLETVQNLAKKEEQ